MSQFAPAEKDPLKHITDLSIQKDIQPNIQMDIIVPQIVEEPITGKEVFGIEKKMKAVPDESPGVKPDVMVNDSCTIPETNAIRKGQGKRGPDKTKRKKKVMSEKQLDALRRGREKSLKTRREKAAAALAAKKAPKVKAPPKTDPIIPAPVRNKALDYSTFSNYMDMYEENKKKKYSTSKEPHPNKVINERLRPQPPLSQPRRAPSQYKLPNSQMPAPPRPKPKGPANWTGNISAYQTHKQKKGPNRWNYGI